MNLYPWAIKWGIPHAALADLQRELGLDGLGTMEQKAGVSEGAVQAAVRLEAAQKGLRLWRNNVGALQDERGVPVRYGLANDSKELNALIKSADLIGIRPRLIMPAQVPPQGLLIGQFVSREIKEVGWAYSATEREQAQMRWAMHIISLGGDAGFATGVGTL